MLSTNAAIMGAVVAANASRHNHGCSDGEIPMWYLGISLLVFVLSVTIGALYASTGTYYESIDAIFLVLVSFAIAIGWPVTVPLVITMIVVHILLNANNSKR